jgi:hypothetical protein
VRFPEPFPVEKFDPLSQRILLADGYWGRVEKLLAYYLESIFLQEFLLLVELILVARE